VTFKQAYNALQCATTTQIKLLTSAHCSLYTSYATPCTLSAWSSHRAIQFQLQPDTPTDI